MKKIKALFCMAALSLGCMNVAAAAAPADYPNRPLRLLVGYPPGGSTDLVARLVAQGLSEKTGQTVVVENLPGAGGNIAAATAAKAPADGYTLYLVTVATTISASLYDKLQYNLKKDFIGVSQASSMTSFLVVHPSLPVHSVKELIELAKAKPGQLDYASSGIGASPHLAGEMFKLMAGVDLVHIPYKGTTPQVTDLIAGVVKVSFPTMPGVIEHVRTGRLRALAINSEQRSPLVPDVPTMAEAGLPGYVDDAWNGVAVAKGTPEPIVSYLSEKMAEVMAMPEIREKLQQAGATAVSSQPAEFTAYIHSEIDKWANVVKKANVTLD